LLVLPFGWQLALAPAVNDIPYAPMHIPFPMIWQMLGIVFASAVIALVFRLDRRAGVEADEAALIAQTQPQTQPVDEQ
jgi:hypothetical protein